MLLTPVTGSLVSRKFRFGVSRARTAPMCFLLKVFDCDQDSVLLILFVGCQRYPLCSG
jgi:hypothetical protein